MAQKTLIVIAGPTASGKTSLALELAERLETEIISADSRQFYREMNIGTAKPNADELSRIPHHFIGTVSVHDGYNAATFEKQALAVLESLFEKKDHVVLVGGSGLFIKAVTEGLDELPQANPELRLLLTKRLETEGLPVLWEELQRLDPVYAKEVDRHNPRRVQRALEVCLVSGKPYSQMRLHIPHERPFRVKMYCPDFPREELYERINERVDKMILAGLPDEVRSLYPYRHLQPLHTVGYTELFEYFDGIVTLEDAISNIKQNTRRYAKRQLTWFRKEKNAQWLLSGQLNAEAILLLLKG